MEIYISRSEQKRRIKQLEKLVEKMVRLPVSLMKTLPCSKEVIDLIRDTPALKGGARKRQVKYITKVLKNDSVDMDAVYAFMSERQGPALQETKEFHEMEYLRDTLLNEAIGRLKLARENHIEMEENWSSQVVAEVGKQFPGIDSSLLTRLAWLFARTRNRKHSREIFRLLRAALEQKRFTGKQKNNLTGK